MSLSCIYRRARVTPALTASYVTSIYDTCYRASCWQYETDTKEKRKNRCERAETMTTGSRGVSSRPLQINMTSSDSHTPGAVAQHSWRRSSGQRLGDGNGGSPQIEEMHSPRSCNSTRSASLASISGTDIPHCTTPRGAGLPPRNLS